MSEVSFALDAGRVLALLGESGSGKSVTLRAILGLHQGARTRVGGEVLLKGRDVNRLDESAREALRGRVVSMVFQEPMTALDPVYTVGEQIVETVQAQILWLLRDLQKRLGLAVIFVTHDLGVAAEIADEPAVLYGGRIVEQAPICELFHRPAHPYTAGPMQATVRRGQKRRPLVPIPGAPPSLITLPPGCASAPRCPRVYDACHATPRALHWRRWAESSTSGIHPI